MSFAASFLECDAYKDRIFHVLRCRWIGKSSSNATKAVSVQQKTSEHDHYGNQLTLCIVGMDVAITRRGHCGCCPVETGDIVVRASDILGFSSVLGPASWGTTTNQIQHNKIFSTSLAITNFANRSLCNILMFSYFLSRKLTKQRMYLFTLCR